jgi:hypothetical protein
MYQEFFSKSPLLALPLVSLVLFIAIFAMVTWRVMGDGGRELERIAGKLPLEEDSDE